MTPLFKQEESSQQELPHRNSDRAALSQGVWFCLFLSLPWLHISQQCIKTQAGHNNSINSFINVDQMPLMLDIYLLLLGTF